MVSPWMRGSFGSRGGFETGLAALPGFIGFTVERPAYEALPSLHHVAAANGGCFLFGVDLAAPDAFVGVDRLMPYGTDHFFDGAAGGNVPA